MFFMKNAVYLTGDTHGRFERIALFCRRQKLAAGDALIILGDAGLNYFGDWRDEDKKKYLSLLPCTIFCIHGNHEQRPSPEMGYQINTYHGGKVWIQPQYPNILFAIDGEVYNFCGDEVVLSVAGAYSVWTNGIALHGEQNGGQTSNHQMKSNARLSLYSNNGVGRLISCCHTHVRSSTNRARCFSLVSTKAL